MYDLSSGNGYRCLFELDVQQLLQKYLEQKELPLGAKDKGPSFISSQPSWQKDSINEESLARLEPGTAVLGIFFIRNPQQPTLQQHDEGIHEVLFGSSNTAAMK